MPLPPLSVPPWADVRCALPALPKAATPPWEGFVLWPASSASLYLREKNDRSFACGQEQAEGQCLILLAVDWALVRLCALGCFAPDAFHVCGSRRTPAQLPHKTVLCEYVTLCDTLGYLCITLFYVVLYHNVCPTDTRPRDLGADPDDPRSGESPASRRGQDKHSFYRSAINSHDNAIIMP